MTPAFFLILAILSFWAGIASLGWAFVAGVAWLGFCVTWAWWFAFGEVK